MFRCLFRQFVACPQQPPAEVGVSLDADPHGPRKAQLARGLLGGYLLAVGPDQQRRLVGDVEAEPAPAIEVRGLLGDLWDLAEPQRRELVGCRVAVGDQRLAEPLLAHQ